jgi:hypothetical protein
MYLVHLYVLLSLWLKNQPRRLEDTKKNDYIPEGDKLKKPQIHLIYIRVFVA